MRLIGLFFYYFLNFKPQSFECHEKQYLYFQRKIIPLELLTSTYSFLIKWGETSFTQLFCNDISLKEAPLSCYFLL